jgi:hypothetical protein
MKFDENIDFLSTFIKSFVHKATQKDVVYDKTLMALISGTILLAKASPNSIQHDLMSCEGASTFYHGIHDLAIGMPTLYDDAFKAVQKDGRLKIRSTGIMVIDEHLIEHTSKNIEGVASYFSPSEKKYINAMSILTMHYWHGTIEYPVMFRIYRRLKELQGRKQEQDYKIKNDIVREMLHEVSALKGLPVTFVFDSAFMTKETALVLKAMGKNYISRPKRPWIVSYKHKRYSIEELFESIPVKEFGVVEVRNPKTRKTKKQLAAVRDVYIPRIGMHRVVFIDCTKERGCENEKEAAETCTAPSGRKYRVFMTNVLTWDAGKILAKYSVRWTIETSYRDMNQCLSLSECKWRELSAQYFFIATTFLCYLFLAWVRVHGFLAGYNSELGSMGQLKEAFIRYCQHQHVLWWIEAKQQSNNDPAERWILARVYASA